METVPEYIETWINEVLKTVMPRSYWVKNDQAVAIYLLKEYLIKITKLKAIEGEIWIVHMDKELIAKRLFN